MLLTLDAAASATLYFFQTARHQRHHASGRDSFRRPFIYGTRRYRQLSQTSLRQLDCFAPSRQHKDSYPTLTAPPCATAPTTTASSQPCAPCHDPRPFLFGSIVFSNFKIVYGFLTFNFSAQLLRSRHVKHIFGGKQMVVVMKN